MSPESKAGALSVFAAALLASFALRAAAADPAADPHTGHHPPPAATVIRSTANYSVPPIKLVRDDGKSVSLADELNDGRPVVLNFIYTTCSGICPLMSHTFSVLQGKLSSMHEPAHLMSMPT